MPLKALIGLALRQVTGLVGGLLELARLDWPLPDVSTLCRRQQDLTVTIPCRSSAGALHLLVDSTGIKAMGEGEWSTRSHGASRPRRWCKVHLGIDAEMLEMQALEGGRANATASREPANGQPCRRWPDPVQAAGADPARGTHRDCHGRWSP